MNENTMHLLLEINRLKAEILVKDTEIEVLKKELALQKLSDISQEIEDRDSAIYATGYWKGVEYKKPRELTNDEIMEVANEVFNTYKNWGYYQIDFARAILKKASERA